MSNNLYFWNSSRKIKYSTARYNVVVQINWVAEMFFSSYIVEIKSSAYLIAKALHDQFV